MKVQTDLVYSSPGGVPLYLDLFLPEIDRPLPTVLMIHGGGWISGDRDMMHEEARWLAPQGFVCACMNYRLAPLHPYPAAVEDVRAAIAFLRENGASRGVDASRVVAFGNSAGGHLAAMAALSGPVDTRANASIAICPIVDLTEPRTQHLAISWGFLEQFMGGAFEEAPERWAEASPLTYAGASAPPMLLIHGVEDDVVPVAQSEALHAALQEAGADSTYIELPGEMHAFSLPAWLRIRDAYVSFLRRVTA